MNNIQKVIITELRRRSMKKSILFSTGSVSGVINNHFMAGVKKGVTPKAVSQVAENFSMIEIWRVFTLLFSHEDGKRSLKTRVKMCLQIIARNS